MKNPSERLKTPDADFYLEKVPHQEDPQQGGNKTTIPSSDESRAVTESLKDLKNQGPPMILGARSIGRSVDLRRTDRLGG